ncbi:MAG: hypothetical protein HUJ29_06250 [Gammaproteobacteria bacterium]|nr:hypothetical protein [Gammaproteobacteria bacterium]
MTKIILIALSTLLVSIIIAYSWFNRDSDRVVLTLVTAMTLGALGFITKESISNKVETFKTEFPVVAFYGLPEYRPLNIKLPYSFDLGMATQNICPEDIPKGDGEHIDIDFGSKIYFDALTYSIVHTLFKNFSNGWNVKAKRVSTPSGESISWQRSDDKGKEITVTEFIDTYFPSNYFFKQGMLKDLPEVFGGKAIFPPGTKITSEVNKDFNQLSITFETDYLTLVLKVNKSSSSVGIGEYSKSFGLPSFITAGENNDNNKIANSVYSMEISGTQKVLLNGHPEMKKHRNWANSLIESLETTYSYTLIRERHIRLIQLYGHDAIKGL